MPGPLPHKMQHIGSRGKEPCSNTQSKGSAWGPQGGILALLKLKDLKGVQSVMLQCQGFKELKRFLTSLSLALLSLLLLPLPASPALLCSSALCYSIIQPHSLCKWEEWIFNEPIISVQCTHKAVTTCTINTIAFGFWQNKRSPFLS